MTILDLKERRELNRRAEWERFESEQERRLAEIERAFEELRPLAEQLIAEQKRWPRCEAPRCANIWTTLHPVAGTSDGAAALINLCGLHLRLVQAGRLRVRADEGDTLLWQLCDGPGFPPRQQIRRPRKNRRCRRATDGC